MCFASGTAWDISDIARGDSGCLSAVTDLKTGRAVGWMYLFRDPSFSSRDLGRWVGSPVKDFRFWDIGIVLVLSQLCPFFFKFALGLIVWDSDKIMRLGMRFFFCCSVFFYGDPLAAAAVAFIISLLYIHVRSRGVF